MNNNVKFSVKDLSLYYGKFHALKGIDMDIPSNEVTAFIGPSGCGKSTFLKSLNRMNDLVEGCKITGDVRLDGEDIYSGMDINLLRKRVGMVFQQPNPFPMSIYDNVAYGPRTHGIRKKAELDEIVERSLRDAAIWDEVKDRLRKNALGLSGGQQQRLCIARALAVEPNVLLMDEPLSNLDAKLRNQMRAEIIKLREKIDTTFIYVTHDQVEAMTLGDRIVIMRDGYIQQIGTPQEVFNHPANLFVAGFIGTPQMNFFENCQLTKTADGYTLTVMGKTVSLTPEQSAKLANAGAESRSVTVGVRPVHITLGENGIGAEVDVSELMGSELHLHLTADGQDIVAVIPTANIDPGAYARHTAVQFGFDAKLVHLFDPETEENLL